MKRILFTATMFALFFSCAKETSEIPENNIFSLSADLESGDDGETKTYIGGNETGASGSLRWSKNDDLAIYSGSSKFDGSLVLTSGDTKTSATFKGSLSGEGDPTYAVYPASRAGTITKDGITVTIPSEQVTSNVSSVGKTNNVSIGKITTEDGASSVAMKNICGLVKIYAPSSKVTSVKLEADQYMTGTVCVDYNSGEPTATVVDGENYVELTGMQHGAMYLVSILPGEYTGLKLTVTFSDNTSKTFKNSGTLTVARNTITSLGVLPVAEYTYTINFEGQTVNKYTTAGGESSQAFACSGSATEFTLYYGILSGADEKHYIDDYLNCLILNRLNSYLRIPQQAGKKLCLVKASSGNGSGAAQRTFCRYKEKPSALLTEVKNSWTVNGYAMTPSYSLCSNITTNQDDGSGDLYLFCGHLTSNFLLRELTLYYTE